VERLLPSWANDRKLSVEPKWSMLMTLKDSVEPVRKIPCTESAEPIREQFLMDRLEPMCTKLNTESLVPNLAKRRTLMVELIST
jgi:hypothetical protein